ncbi:hypothetical protein VULLAG_LOCUS5240 [Vulpes lagopus]
MSEGIFLYLHLHCEDLVGFLEVKPTKCVGLRLNCFPRVSHSHARSHSLQYQFVALAASVPANR